MDDTVEQLDIKILDNKKQLEQVEDLLKMSPRDEELLKIHGELNHLIKLTQDLRNLKSPNTSTSAVPPPLPADFKQERKWKAGDRCLALWEDNKPYVSRIDAVTEVGTYKVTYLDYGTTSEVADSSLSQYVPAPADKLMKGALVRAIWPEDGLYYDAVVDSEIKMTSISEKSKKYIVRFTKFKKKKEKRSLEVSGYDLVLRKELGDIEDFEGAVPDKFEIPDHLKSVPNDTEQVKKDKLKKIKRLKSKHRKMLMEQAGQQKKSSWQVFQNKGKTPLVVGGFLKGKKRKKHIRQSR